VQLGDSRHSVRPHLPVKAEQETRRNLDSSERGGAHEGLALSMSSSGE